MGPDEGDVLDGAACLREAWPGKVVCARHVVRPVEVTQPVPFIPLPVAVEPDSVQVLTPISSSLHFRRTEEKSLTSYL